MKQLFLALTVCGLMTLSACTTPKAKGLPPNAITLPESQQQAELFWQDHTFAFLLYQEAQSQKPSSLQILALTLSGQLLFELHYDGQTLHTVQKHPKLKSLPVDFLMRDIWWASMPLTEVQSAINKLGLDITESDGVRTIYPVKTPNQAKLIAIQGADGTLSIENKDVPYKVVMTGTGQFVE